MKKTETIAAETLNDEILIEKTIKVWDYNFWDKLFRRPKELTFKIYRIRVCNMERCAGIAVKIPEINTDITTTEQLIATTMPLIAKFKDDVVYLIAACIQNNSKSPKKSLIKFIDENFTSDDLFDVLITCLAQNNLQSFYSAILLLGAQSVNIAKAKDADLVNTVG